ncbi:hypothetical protein BBO99_00007703 [Phytophthora kernoviae]|uniref:RING-type domain-containing protein n=2 Tax=Phytophthora kernoviae TaxID=325452 RepID=A0A3R7J468_9STRA|nr:hypothetical protein G195_007552 [Phytophthora kernoviae 00238/432]KAG2515850.1 hypothetical protein JM16_007693 [Phytophthora kernoviae]KAG2519367.1 hypothetical protein JM18_007579 [Phytophthora kernoviae]RLN05974.1 hypothetical protein BBI17_007640 [Phytophthora kernoviae]RLN76263.1 hypothetical protein BBO99_00007703 [Phytophthora kernoviae]
MATVPRREQIESSVTIATLQENLTAITAFNQREKAFSSSLKNEVARLTKELAKLNEEHEAEKQNHDKITLIQKEKPASGPKERFLPDINGAATLTATTVALQQHTQMEVSYQRKQDEQLVDNLRKSLERCQRDLDDMKKRDKLLQEEHAKFKTSTAQEKETMMGKILGLQQHLQQSDTAEGITNALEIQVKRLQKEKAAVSVELEASSYRCNDLLARVTLMDKLSTELAQVKLTMEKERENAEAELRTKNQELKFYVHQLKDADARIQEGNTRILEAEARNASVQDLTALIKTRDEELATLMQKFVQLEGDLKDQEQRNSGLQDEANRLNNELQNLKQLSQDETVQALQMARQKAANYEALTLLNEEKCSLEEQLRQVQERLEYERVALQEEKDAKEKLLASLGSNDLTVDELREEKNALLEQIQQIRDSKKTVAEAAVQTTMEENINAGDLAQSDGRLEALQGQFDEFRRTHDEMELGYKKLISREKYKAESFQNQLRLLQSESTELTEKVEELCSKLEKEQQLTSTQNLKMADLKSRVLSRESIDLLRKTQDSLEQTVTSLMEAEHASESTFTCLQCIQLFTSPMTLAPCGHTYCAACLAKYGSVDVPSAISCKIEHAFAGVAEYGPRSGDGYHD